MKKKQSGLLGNIFVLLISIAFVAGGLCFSWQGLSPVVDGTRARTWPSVVGTVTASEYRVLRNNSKNYRVEPAVQYAYTVDGVERTGKRLQFKTGSKVEPSEARRLLNRFPAGAKVDVFYNADEPTESVLIQGTTGEAWWLIPFGLIFVLVGSVLIWAILFGKEDENDEPPVIDANGSKGRRRLGAILLLIGALVLAMAGHTLRKASVTKLWPTVVGTVIYSGAKDTSSDESTSYSPYVVYDYVVDGVTYTSGGITVRDRSVSTFRKALDIAREYPTAQAVTVSYDPSDPYDAVLEPGRSGNVWVGILAGGVFSLLGVAMMIGRSHTG